jgi:hypothetical protein
VLRLGVENAEGVILRRHLQQLHALFIELAHYRGFKGRRARAARLRLANKLIP